MAEAPAVGPGSRVAQALSQFFVPKDKPLKPVNPVVTPPNPAQPQMVPQLDAKGAPVLDANGTVVMVAPSNDPSKNISKDPLDMYKDLFQPIQSDEKAPKAPTYSLTPEVINKAAGSMDFMSDLPAELAANLQAGQFDAKTIAGLVNHASRQA